MIESLISSKTRIKLLLKFFLNSNTTAYLRSLESEFGESSNSIRIELNKMESAGMLSSFTSGNKKLFKVNKSYPLYREIRNILIKHIGLDTVVETVVERLGEVHKVYLTGSFSRGIDSPVIDLVFIGNIDKVYLISLIDKAEKIVNRKIRYLIYNENDEYICQFKDGDEKLLVLWDENSQGTLA